MAATVDDFMAAIDAWSEETGESPDLIYTSVLIGAGLIFTVSEEEPSPTVDELVEQVSTGEYSRRYRAQFERALRRLIDDAGMHEDFLIIGAVRYVEHFLEDTLENAAKRRQETATSLQADREMFSEVEDKRREEMLRKIDRMEAMWAPPITAERLRGYRIQLEAWRANVVPILSE